MTIGQYEILRNRLDGIIGSESRLGLKLKRLYQMLGDVIASFSDTDNYAKDLALEIVLEMDRLHK